MNEPIIYWIDLFCGAGGTSTGIEMADANAQVIACVNHDQKAIESHKANHPDCLHFVEDIRDFNVVLKLKSIVEKLKLQDNDCIVNIWASLECTNYSKAKGGLPRDADSRTLAEHLFMYLEHLDPDYLYIENVREFMAWGPLDKNGRPISRKNGTDYIKWCNKVQSYGFNFEHRILNAADFGAYTSRQRYFGQFAKNGMPISWPEPTHAKNLDSNSGLFASTKKKWKPVKEVLDLKDEGNSIFDRKKPLSENTLKRIYAGLIKFVADGNTDFMTQFGGGDPKSKIWGIDKPTRTVTSFTHNKVSAVFLSTYYGNGATNSIDAPCPTITTKDRVSKIHPQFIVNNYSNGGQLTDLGNPAPTVTNVPKSNLTTCNFMDQQYGQSKPNSIEGPLNAITANPKFNLVTTKPWIMDTNFNNVGASLEDPSRVILASRKHHYLMNPVWIFDHQFGNKGRSIEEVAPTIIARQDKKPLYIVNCDQADQFGIVVFKGDSIMTLKIKQFMAAYKIVDIKMRMLRVDELLQIQGFPKGYKLKGTKTDQKRFIGNAVEVKQARALIQSNFEAIKAINRIAI